MLSRLIVKNVVIHLMMAWLAEHVALFSVTSVMVAKIKWKLIGKFVKINCLI
jgi:hypothetical protein